MVLMACVASYNLTSQESTVSYQWVTAIDLFVNKSLSITEPYLPINSIDDSMSKRIPFDSAASPDDFPLINNQPLVFTIMLIYLCCLIKLLPNLMSTRLPFNLRPWLVVFNGLMFGAYWAGFVIFVYCFPPWRYIMYGEAATQETPLIKMYYVYLHNLIFWARLVDLSTPVFKLLTKKDPFAPILHGVYTSIIVTSYSLGYELESKEPYTILPMFDGLKVIIRIIYYIPMAPGNASMKVFTKTTAHWINIAINLIGLSTVAYLFTTSYKFSRTLYAWVVCITIIETIFHLIGIYFQHKNPPISPSEQSKKHIQ